MKAPNKSEVPGHFAARPNAIRNGGDRQAFDDLRDETDLLAALKLVK